MSQENVEVIRLLGERHDAGDRAGVLESIHPDFELFPPEDEPEAKGVYRGREGWLEYDAYWDETFTHWEAKADEYIDAREYVVVVGRIRGKGRASGAEVDSPIVWLWRVLDGMGIEFRQYRTKSRPRSRRAAGVGDVAGERGDLAQLPRRPARSE